MTDLTANNKTRKLKFIIVLGLLACITAFFILDTQQWLSLETIKQQKQTLLNFTEQHYGLAILSAGLLYIIATALSIPGATVLSLTIGFVFGRTIGTLLIVISATIGATLVFLLARYLFAGWAKKRIDKNPLTQKIINGFQNDAASYMLFLRLAPIFPFWLVNIAPAFTAISTQTYILVGIIPGSFVYANLGKSLASIDNVERLLSTEMILALSLLGVLSLLPIAAKKLTSDNAE
jgi:uncharacterized membrane protein YdjX (TVP38/TMEM64 family)